MYVLLCVRGMRHSEILGELVWAIESEEKWVWNCGLDLWGRHGQVQTDQTDF